MKIKYYLQRNSKLCCYHLKCKKRRMIVGFTTNKHKKCINVHYQKQLYIKIMLTRGKYCQEANRYKETRILLIYAVAFS